MNLRWMVPEITPNDIKDYQSSKGCSMLEARLTLREKNPVVLQYVDPMSDDWAPKWIDVPFVTGIQTLDK